MATALKVVVAAATCFVLTVASPSVDIVVPGDGDVMHKGEKFHVNAFVDGIQVPEEGYGLVFVNDRQIGKMDTNHFTLSRPNPLKIGEHTLTIRVYDPAGNEFEQAAEIRHFSVDDAPPEDYDEQQDVGYQGDFSTDTKPLAEHSSAFGLGLSAAAAGVPATFSIVLRDADNRVVLSREPPKLVAVIQPAPIGNKLMATETGEYACEYECEYGGSKHTIAILLDDVHIQGSPFTFVSNMSYDVRVKGPIQPKPRPALPPLPDYRVARSNPRVREFFLPQKWREMEGETGRFGYITMITGDDYLIGALVLLHSLRSVGVTDTDIICMVTENIRQDTVDALQLAGFKIKHVTKVDIPHHSMVEERWSDNYTKLLMWLMLEYDRLVYLDADMLVLQPIDHLFHVNIGPAGFAATPDCWLPTFFSAASFVFKPSQAVYNAMMDAIPHLPAEESEQTFLNEFFFESWVALHYSHNTPKNFGMTPTRFNLMWERHLPNVRVIHYMGMKPFLCTRYKDCTAHTGHYNVPQVFQLWWDRFDAMCDEDAIECL